MLGKLLICTERRSKLRRGGGVESRFRSGYATLEGLEETSAGQQVMWIWRQGERFSFKSHQCTSLRMDQIIQRECIE